MIIDPQQLEERLLNKIVEPKNKRILEVGCGQGKTSYLLAKESEGYWAIDVDPKVIALARKDLSKQLQDKVNLGVRSGIDTKMPKAFFDIVLMQLCLHEISVQEQGLALVEAHRVLKSGGKMIIIDPKANQPVSVQALYDVINSKIKLFDHNCTIRHSKWVIKQAINQGLFSLAKKGGYEIEWHFGNFEELTKMMVNENPDVDWSPDNKRMVFTELASISNVSDNKSTFKVMDILEYTILEKRD